MKVRLIMTALVAASVIQPAAGQIASGRSGHSSTIDYGQEVAMQAVAYFGYCLSSSYTRKALEIVATAPNSREEYALFRKYVFGENAPCIPTGGALTTQVSLMRGAIAEGLWRKRAPLPAEMKQTGAEAAEVRDLSGAARCYVMHEPASAAALMETGAGGRKEQAAVLKLLPELAKCVPPGVRLNYPATLIRFRIAEALYRLGNVRPEAQNAG